MAQRPFLAAAAVTIASVSSDFHEKILSTRPSNPFTSRWKFQSGNSRDGDNPDASSALLSIKPPFLTTSSHVPIPNIISLDFMKHQHHHYYPSPSRSSPPEVLYRWHLPKPNSPKRSKTVLVLLGWLGAKQKHMRRYAEWYTERGFNVITFTFPMSDILSCRLSQKAEQNAEKLADHLADWLEDADGKNLVFHTFSNTGWLTYGVILGKFRRENPFVMEMIRGCIVDSAPAAVPDPRVFASGFAAAFLKKGSVAGAETTLLLFLELVFGVVLNLPSVNRRVCGVIQVLSDGQPLCPQLYMYSSADRVIPSRYVESFMEAQQKAGRAVRACDFVSTPHVDHFRNNPGLYASQISHFLEDVLPSHYSNNLF